MDDAETLVTCPYNKAHTIRKCRMQFHLKKCRAVSDSSNVLICPYNACHHICKEDFEEHERNCKDRKALDMFMYNMSNDTPSPSLVPVGAVELPPPEEDWGEETVDRPVLEVIQEEVLKKNILRNAQCVPKAERKAHRVNERIRHQQLFTAPAGAPTKSSFKADS